MDRQYLQTLTWLRAVAAFLVVVAHTMRASEVQYSPDDVVSYFLPLNILDLGPFAVYLFFALSGCTLYISNNNKIHSLKDFGPFYIKRFMRIWPTFAVSLLVYLVFIEIFRHFYISDKSLWIADFLNDYTLGNIFQYLSLTFNITGPSDLFAGPYWTLPVEFQYYLLLPFVLLLMSAKRFELLPPLIVGCVLYFLYEESVFQFDRDEFFKMGFSFFGGVMIAQYHKGAMYRLPFCLSIVAFLFVILIAGTIRLDIISIPSNIPFISEKWNLYGVLALLSVYLAVFSRSPKKTNKFLVFLQSYGEVSYSIYLFHMIFVGIATLLVVNYEIYGDSAKLFFIFFFSIISSYMFSIFTYRFVELPSIKIGRKYARRLIDSVSFKKKGR